MKIASSAINMSSTHALTQKTESSETLATTGVVGRGMAKSYGLDSDRSGSAKIAQAAKLGGASVRAEHIVSSQSSSSASSVVTISSAAKAAAGAGVIGSTGVNGTAGSGSVSGKSGSEDVDPKIQVLISAVEKITGHKIHITSIAELTGGEVGATGTPSSATGTQAAASNAVGWGVSYDSHQSYSETENTTFSAGGTVKTADGQEINFQMNLSMDRSYYEENNISVRLGDAKMTDPLVLNFDGSAAELSDATFSFDIDSDGDKEQIHQLQSGSGYLALDKNNDGTINNGNELFGTASGNGFADLAQYDDDKNGWIDENDKVFDQLKIWGADGSLQSLKQADVGAISLQNQATSFYLKNSSNETLGQVVSSGVFLKESGGVGSVQQINLAV